MEKDQEIVSSFVAVEVVHHTCPYCGELLKFTGAVVTGIESSFEHLCINPELPHSVWKRKAYPYLRIDGGWFTGETNLVNVRRKF